MIRREFTGRHRLLVIVNKCDCIMWSDLQQCIVQDASQIKVSFTSTVKIGVKRDVEK